MRKPIYIALVLLSALLVQSCTSEYPALFYASDSESNQNKEMYTDIEITPTLTDSALFFSPSTRGSFAFDNKNFPADFKEHYLSSKFYLMAYRRSMGVAGELSQPADYRMLMNSQQNVDNIDCLVSAETTSPTEKGHRGAVARAIDMVGALAFWNDDVTKKMPLLWSKKYFDVGYDFFGYYIDDAYVSKVVQEPDQIYMDITYDGTQDIMVGAAPELTRKLILDNSLSVVEESTVDTIIMYGNGGYSTYAAYHGLQPKIELRHCLTRFLFDFTLSGDKSIWIKDVRIKAQTEGRLVVAAREHDQLGLTPSGEEKMLSMGSFSMKLVEDEAVMIGKGMMVPPKNAYELEVDFDEQYYTDESKTNLVTIPQTIKINLQPENEVFQAGTTYLVKVNMYGAQKVTVTSTLQKWKPGIVDNGDGKDYIDIPMQEQ